MSAGFGTDLSHVRLHTGTEATDLNNRLQARAFTVGSDVFLRDSASLRSGAGQELLAHELTHVVQQSSGHEVARRLFDALSVHEIKLWEKTPLAMDGSCKGGRQKRSKAKTPPAGTVQLVETPVVVEGVKYYQLAGSAHYVREENVQIGDLDEKRSLRPPTLMATTAALTRSGPSSRTTWVMPSKSVAAAL